MKIELTTIRNVVLYPRSIFRAYRSISNKKFSEYVAGRRKLLWFRVAKENLYFRGSDGCQLGDIFSKNYRLIGRYFSAVMVNRLIEDKGLLLLKLSSGLEIFLSAARHNDKEAELYLKIYREDEIIYILGFVIVAPDSIYPNNETGILITRLQGVKAHKTAVDQSIKEFGNVSLDRILMAAISGIARFMQVKVIHAISHKMQVYYRAEFNNVFSNTYDDFWETYEADFNSNFYSIRLPFREKPLENIKANHRKRTERKRNVQKNVTNFVSDRLSNKRNGLKIEPIFLTQQELQLHDSQS